MDRPPVGSSDDLRSVLIATDLSETATLAQRWAEAIAVAHGARLHIVHALHLAGWSTDYLEIDARVPAGLETTCRAQLEQLASDASRAGLEVEEHLIRGEPCDSILRFSTECRADLVVVGTRGHGVLDSWLLGSTARRVVQRARCPVLTVGPARPDRPRSLMRILVATDFSTEAEAALIFAADLLAGLQTRAEIILLHAYLVPYDVLPSDGFVSAANGLEQRQTARHDVQRRLEALAAKVRRDGVGVTPVGIEGYPPDVITDEAAKREVDLIAMGTHGRTGLSHAFLGSIAEKVIHRATRPVLTVRGDRTRAKNGGTHARREAQELPE